MAFSSQGASTSAPSAPPRKYHVFLGFRGIDTRKGFTGHLYDRLKFRSITTFWDDREIDKGIPISPNLLRAIEESWFAIIILSPNFASSTWCLDEVSKIVECMEVNTILPIFYDVDPSDVRKQMGTFAEAFNKHKRTFRKNTEKVQRWRDALKKVASVAGWPSKDRNENELIEEIVEAVCNKVYPTIFTLLGSTKNLVGIDFRLKKIESLIDDEAKDDVLIIGIWGPEGTGKTTIARLVYERKSHHFDVSCFLANAKEVCATHGLVHLQKQLLSPILKQKVNEIWDVHSGITMTKYCLCNKKVLLVIDDVDQLNQLETLAGKNGWFGSGSRIIITTRKEHLLIEYGIEDPHEFLTLKDNEAVQQLQPSKWKCQGKDESERDQLELSQNHVDNDCQLEDDEPSKTQSSNNDEQPGKVPKVRQGSLKVYSPPRYIENTTSTSQSCQILKVCAVCKRKIDDGQAYSDFEGGAFYLHYPQCSLCHACNLPVTSQLSFDKENHLYHTSCFHPRCVVCKHLVPLNSDGISEYNAHPFWLQQSCRSHDEIDKIPRCWSCARIQPWPIRYHVIDNGLHLCLQCRASAITDDHKCQSLFLEIKEYFEVILNMKVKEKIPIFLVDKPTLLKYCPNSNTLSETPYSFISWRSMPCRKVTGIYILKGLPRLLTGSILSDGMMCAWLLVMLKPKRKWLVTSYPKLSQLVEDGICVVLSHMWLDFEMHSGSNRDKMSAIERTLGKYFQHRIESKSEEFQIASKAVLKHGLRHTLDHIRITGSFPLVK